MAGRLTMWGAGQILRTYFSKTSEPPPNFYLALIKDLAPTPYVSGSELDEPGLDTGYARAELPNDAASWTAEEGTLHITGNAVEVTFITAQADWGNINYWALCNADAGGYCVAVGNMEEPNYVSTGDQVVLGTDELTIELGPFFTDEDF